MAEMVQYLALAAIFAVASSLPNGKDEGVIRGIPRIPLNGTTFTSTNVSRVGNGEENESHGGVHRFQIGNVTTFTNASKSTKSLDCVFGWWVYPFYWTSPNFGIENYPNNALCQLYGGGGPAIGEFTFQPLDLQRKKNGKCVDFVSITYPYGVVKKWCGTDVYKTVRIPTYNYEAQFFSDDRIRRPGFNVTINIITDAPCYQFIYLAQVGEWFQFATPNYPNLDWEKKRMCELIVQTNWGNRLQLDFEGFDLKPPCKKNNVVVNLENEWNYPQATSSQYCGNSLPPTTTSTWNEIHLVYQASKRNVGFKVNVTVVPGGYWTTQPWTPWTWHTSITPGSTTT